MSRLDDFVGVALVPLLMNDVVHAIAFWGAFRMDSRDTDSNHLPSVRPLLNEKQPNAFSAPTNPDVRIWRYMDFTKFVSMLEHQGLFFTRADLIGDAFEGSFARQNIEQRRTTYSGLDWEKVMQLFELYKSQRAYLLLNCWHINDQESAAMWKLYAKSNEAIAVQSTFAHLRSVLAAKVGIGMVNYIDYDHARIPEGNIFFPIMHKRTVTAKFHLQVF
ncbi:MAG: hypothetical protein HZB51_08990 [Chloroflexi bacterium]|nr:hypothetical protein [Chloroflexota bacterium]